MVRVALKLKPKLSWRFLSSMSVAAYAVLLVAALYSAGSYLADARYYKTTRLTSVVSKPKPKPRGSSLLTRKHKMIKHSAITANHRTAEVVEPKTNSAERWNDYYSDNTHVAEMMQQHASPSRLVFPEPLEILRDYISQHGVGRHASQPRAGNQKYLLLSYSCPNRAGNEFSNAVGEILLAILTNRTLLVKPPNDAADHDGVVACERIVHRSSWIPEATPAILGSENVHTWRQRQLVGTACMNMFNTSKQDECTNFLKHAPTGAAAKMAVDVSKHSVIEIAGLVGCFTSPEMAGWKGRFDMRLPTCSDMVKASFVGEIIDQQRIDKLFMHGLDFVYGMLFRHAFSLTDELLNSVQTTGDSSFDPTAFSVAVHSRHAQQKQDGSISSGSDIRKETVCLDQILSSYQQNANATSGGEAPPKQKCQLLIMSDRQATNTALTAYAKRHGCDGITVVHDTQVKSNAVRKEHGPFEGAGFFADLALVTRARSGFIATMRSSSSLLQHLLVYDRTMERLQHLAAVGSGSHQHHQESQQHGLEICYI